MKANKKAMLLGGAFTGALNGLFGGGGGMVAVPVLRKSAGYSQLSAHATAIAVILPVSALSALIYLIYGLIPLQTFLPVMLGTVLGGFLGAEILPFVPARVAGILFAALMLAAGIRMLV